LGVPPLYVGEFLLGIGLLTLMGTGAIERFFRARTASTMLLLAYMAWGALCTLPYVPAYGMLALRDAALWGYGTFALLLVPLVVHKGLLPVIPGWYRRLLPWIILVTPYWVLLGEWARRSGLTPESLGVPKPGDAAVHLGGAAAFLLAGLGGIGHRGAHRPRPIESLAWPALLVGLLAVGSWTRGGLLSALVAMMVVLLMVPLRAGGKLLLAAVIAIFVGTAWLGSGVSIAIREDRVINPQQVLQNLGSVGGAGAVNLEETREWRLQWWRDIVDYTVYGRHFWTGKGYGINLTYDDGIESDPNVPSRSPHNVNMTVLARSGVPGFVLWVGVQGTFALALLGAFIRARRRHDQTRVALIAWVLAYWCAFLVNASFDVYLEGPQGGIWFWCIFAYGLALVVGGEQHAAYARAESRAAVLRQRQNATV
jgi:O-antigen ligase